MIHLLQIRSSTFILLIGLFLAIEFILGYSIAIPENKTQPINQALLKDSLDFLDNGILRLGVNLGAGGAIAYLSDARNRDNIINNHDLGRQIQLSFYSGPKPYTPNGKMPAEMWKNLGWNPIQSGDYKGNTSKIIDYKNDGRNIYIKCQPMQWPLDNEPADCFFEVWITLDKNTVKVRNRLTNHRADKKQYKGTGQELPAVYTVVQYNDIVTYSGSNPFQSDTITHIKNINKPNQPIKWASWEATENWSAALNSRNWGLGIWTEGAQHFLGGFAGNKNASSTEKDYLSSTTYIAPIIEEVLDNNIIYEYNYTLILGSLQDIRNYVYSNRKQKNIPSYSFIKDRSHWTFDKTTDTGWPISGYLQVKIHQQGAALISPNTIWQAKNANILHIEAAFHTQSLKGRIYWKRFGDKDFIEINSMEFKYISDDNFHTINIPLNKSYNYKGAIQAIKIIPATDSTSENDWIKVKSITF